MPNLIQPYFIGSLYFLFVWIIVFLFNKKDKKEQILFSLAGTVLGPLVQFMHLSDWWFPTYIYPNGIHLEDLIFGFAVGGVIAVIYDVIFIKKFGHIKKSLQPKHGYIILLVILSMFALFGLFYFFRVSSFWSSVISCSIMFIFVALKRHDLVITMIVSGLLIVVIAFPAYLIGLQINPNWIQSEWLLQNLSGLTLLGVPLEEFIWFFFVGLGASAIYELVFNVKLLLKYHITVN